MKALSRNIDLIYDLFVIEFNSLYNIYRQWRSFITYLKGLERG